jgi:hypothetical protein
MPGQTELAGLSHKSGRPRVHPLRTAFYPEVVHYLWISIVKPGVIL